MRTITRTLLLLAAGAGLGACLTLTPATAQESDDPDIAAISAILDDFHDAASKGDGERYFGHFAARGRFLGTDKNERWTVEQFQQYAAPYFSAGQGWTYTLEETPEARDIVIHASGSVAWVDERLQGEKYGSSRGTATLVIEKGLWKIAQYHLSFPIPNEMAPTLTTAIIDFEADQERIRIKTEKSER